MVNRPDIETLRQWLHQVKDPEIPVLSLVDLGVIDTLEYDEEGTLQVEIVPTFSGCPAMDAMKSDVENLLASHHVPHLVRVNIQKPWTTDKISEQGLKALQKHGLALPGRVPHITDIDVLEQVACPQCGSTNTRLDSLFGPTLCRALHYCNSCLQAFEQFKPL